jgi:hypothetical protein
MLINAKMHQQIMIDKFGEEAYLQNSTTLEDLPHHTKADGNSWRYSMHLGIIGQRGY